MMIWTPLKAITPKNSVGIDIGTSSIKIVELRRFGRRVKLENYGEIEAQAIFEKPFRTFEKSTVTISTQDVARAILSILETAKIKTKQAWFSIPDFSSFFTWFSLPPMTKEEVPEAVIFEARQHIPIPSSEVTLDWQIIEGKINREKSPLKILLVAVPNEVINQYQEIARLSRLELLALEAEVFGLARSIAGEDKEPMILVDIGAQSTTASIIDNKILKSSHSFDIAGNELTQALARSLNIEYKEAEDLKEKYGLLASDKDTDKILFPLVDIILNEIEKISKNLYQSQGREIKKVVLAGGAALLPGLDDYFSRRLQKPVEIVNPFSNIFFPPILEETLKEMGPSYAIAVGMALRGLE